jgi:hypothetical protein
MEVGSLRKNSLRKRDSSLLRPVGRRASISFMRCEWAAIAEGWHVDQYEQLLPASLGVAVSQSGHELLDEMRSNLAELWMR